MRFINKDFVTQNERAINFGFYKYKKIKNDNMEKIKNKKDFIKSVVILDKNFVQKFN